MVTGNQSDEREDTLLSGVCIRQCSCYGDRKGHVIITLKVNQHVDRRNPMSTEGVIVYGIQGSTLNIARLPGASKNSGGASKTWEPPARWGVMVYGIAGFHHSGF